MTINFSVTKWSAWSPSLQTPESWIRWAETPSYRETETAQQPAIKSIPPLLRRRFDLQGKMAAACVMDCLDDLNGIPIVFCSRHGEVARSAEMLSSMSNGEPVSPTAFSLSVHNAVAGLLSIIRADRSNYITISSRSSLVESGIIETYGLLNDGAEKVLLVVYGNTLPECFSAYKEQDEQAFAFACLIEKDGSNRISLAASSTQAPVSRRSDIPQELQVFRFFLTRQASLETAGRNKTWHWSRHV